MHNFRNYPIVLDLPEGRIEAQVELPDRGERLVVLAYKVLGLSSVAADMGARAAGRLGMQVSCRKGCAACCRQLVPLSPPEAGMVFEFVKTMPEPRKSAIVDRFARAVQQLRKAGLLTELERLRDPGMSDETDRAVSKAYFREQIACPFLEEEGCSIYPVRPSICREYMVVSPPENCADPYAKAIRRVPLSLRMSEALTHMWAALGKRRPELVPFALALRWTRENAAIGTLAARPGVMVNALVEQIQSFAAELETRGG